MPGVKKKTRSPTPSSGRRVSCGVASPSSVLALHESHLDSEWLDRTPTGHFLVPTKNALIPGNLRSLGGGRTFCVDARTVAVFSTGQLVPGVPTGLCCCFRAHRSLFSPPHHRSGSRTYLDDYIVGSSISSAFCSFERLIPVSPPFFSRSR